MRLATALAAVLLAAGPVSGQQVPAAPDAAPAGIPQSSVVVLDRDELFATSRFGRRVAADIEAASADLAAENGRIEAELEAEEKALTERRADMEPEAFRQLAADFDSRVTDIRATQDAKARAITQQSERAQTLFFEQANSILVDLAGETGALVILDRRSVIASADQVDITALARDRIDAALGDGEDLQSPPPPRRPAPVAPEGPPPVTPGQ